MQLPKAQEADETDKANLCPYGQQAEPRASKVKFGNVTPVERNFSTCIRIGFMTRRGASTPSRPTPPRARQLE